VKAGTAVDIPPGSALETAYGGPANLTPVQPWAGDEACFDKSALSN
jgi:hypothetical protein